MSPKKLRLIKEEDPKGSKKEPEPERKVEGPKWDREKEIEEETELERKAEGEERTEQQDFILLWALKIACWQIFSFLLYVFVVVSYF